MAEGSACRGGHVWQGGAWQGACVARTPHPRVNRMADACKNITLPQTSFAGGKKTWAGFIKHAQKQTIRHISGFTHFCDIVPSKQKT